MRTKLPVNQNTPAMESSFFRVWAEIVLKYRWMLLGISLLCSVALGIIAYRDLSIDNSADALLSSTDKSMKALKELRDEFGPDRRFLVLAEGDVFTLEYLKRLKQLHQDLSGINLKLDSLGKRKGDDVYKRSLSININNNIDGQSKSLNRGTKSDSEFVDFEPVGSTPTNDFEDDRGWDKNSNGTIFERIISLVNIRRTSGENGTLSIKGLLDKWPTEDTLLSLKHSVLSDRNLVGQIVGKEGRHSVIMLMTDFMDEEDTAKVYQEILKIVSKNEAEGFNLQVAGSAAFTAEIDSMILNDFSTFTTLAAIVMIVLLIAIFRHPVGVIGPIFVVAQSAIWILGAMAIADIPMTMVTNILPAFLACVGIGDSVHILSVYRDVRARSMPNREAIVYSVAVTGAPVFYTSLTTAIGLLGFHLSSLKAIGNMGTFGALGIFIALLYSLVFIPIVLTFNKSSLLGAKIEADKLDPVDRFLAFCTSLSRTESANSTFSHTRRRITLISAFSIAAIACFGVSMIRTYHNPLTWMPRENQIRKSIEKFNDMVGGAAHVSILIEAPRGSNIRNRELLISLQKLADHIKSYKDPTTQKPIVGTITSILDPVRESFRALNNNKEAFYKIPDTQAGVNDIFSLFRNFAPDELKSLITIDDTKSLMTIRVNWMDAHAYEPLIKHIQSGVHKTIGEQAKIKITGTVITFHRIMSAFAIDLLKSFGSACIVITLIMVALLRSVKLGLVAMIPNLLPILAIMGFMGIVSIPLDMSTLLIASIIIGIAVDDTIHFLHQFKVHFSIDKDVDSAIEYAVSHTGRAMLSTSMILVIGFSVYLSATMYNLQRFGMLSALAIVFAFLFDIIFTPALLRTVYGSKYRMEKVFGELSSRRPLSEDHCQVI